MSRDCVLIYFKKKKKKFFVYVMTFSFKIILATLFYEIISMKVSTLILSYNILYLSTKLSVPWFIQVEKELMESIIHVANNTETYMELTKYQTGLFQAPYIC